MKSIYELKSEAYNLLSKDWGNAIGVTFILFCVSIAASMVPVSYTHLTLPTTPYV